MQNLDVQHAGAAPRILRRLSSSLFIQIIVLTFNFFQGAIRISKKSYDSDNARKYGPQDLWHHVHCFKSKREELEFSESAEAIPGFTDLTPEDQKMLKKELPAQSGK